MNTRAEDAVEETKAVECDEWEYLCPNLHWGGQYGCDLCGCDLCFNGCDLYSNVKDIDNNNMRKEWLNKCNKYCYKLHKKWLEEKMARKSGWESEVDSDEEMSDDEPMCCVGCGKDGKFPENRDGDTMCECCMSDEEDEDSDDEDSDEE